MQAFTDMLDADMCADDVAAYILESVRRPSRRFVHERDDDGKAAMHLVAERHRFDLVELLATCGAHVNLQDYNGNTPLHLASAVMYEDQIYRAVRTVAVLMNCGANVNVHNENGTSPLCYAIRFGDHCLDVVRELVENAPDILLEEDALDLAVAQGDTNVDVVDILLRAGAPMPDGWRNRIRSPLTVALMSDAASKRIPARQPTHVKKPRKMTRSVRFA